MQILVGRLQETNIQGAAAGLDVLYSILSKALGAQGGSCHQNEGKMLHISTVFMVFYCNISDFSALWFLFPLV